MARRGGIEAQAACGAAGQIREVTLGLTDGKVIEIKSGLTAEETVAVPGPNLPAAKTQQTGVPGFGK